MPEAENDSAIRWSQVGALHTEIRKTSPKVFDLLDGGLWTLPDVVSPAEASDESQGDGRAWDLTGLYYYEMGRFAEACAAHLLRYRHVLRHQDTCGRRFHKGTPLVRVADCHWAMGNDWGARYYLMLTLVEDSIEAAGNAHALPPGCKTRLERIYGVPPSQIAEWCTELYGAYCAASGASEFHYPERVLQDLGGDWSPGTVSPREAGSSYTEPLVVDALMSGLAVGDSGQRGIALEVLAQYLLGSIRGCRALRRVLTYSTDLDVVARFEGPLQDFRSDLGRHIVCECKNWAEPAGFTELAKFSRVLDSVKCRFGVLFSRNGISDQASDGVRDAAREQQKLYQDRGMVIAVVTGDDLAELEQGRPFLSLLRAEYERIRLDLQKRT